jgi:CRISPR/Cas system-associated exonuclease Cas4 (RecB family)
MEGLGDVISEIFDPEKPFEQAPDAKSCKFCGFKAICGREEARDY